MVFIELLVAGSFSGTVPPHAATHKAGGTDAILIDELGAPTDNTNNNVTTSHHGFVPKASGNATEFLAGDATWKIPAGSGGSGGTGEANTYSNAGLTGVGVVLVKSGVDLPFKSIAANSNKIAVSNDAANKAVNIDVTEANLTLSNIGGAITSFQAATGTVFQTSTQTVSNKTIPTDTNFIKHSTTNNAGDLLANTGTVFDRFAVGAANQLLAVNAAGNNIAWKNPIFASSTMQIQNPAGTFAYILVGSAITANRNVTLPLLTGNDTFAFTGFNNTWSAVQNFPNLSTVGTNIVLSNTGLTAARTFTFPDSTTTLVGTADSRLSDARTPTAHATTHSSGGSDPITLSNLAGAVTTGQLPSGIPHSKVGTNLILSESGLTAIRTVTFPDSTGLVVYSTDSRLSDARTPTAHKTTHQTGGSDAIPLDTLAATTDVTTLNSTTTAHGLLPKLSGNASEYLNGGGTFSVPSGTGTGEANTASNQGTGAGWFKAKSGVDLQFKSFIMGSTKLALTSNVNDLTVDVTEANLNIANMTGSIGDSRITDLAYTKLTGVPSSTGEANTYSNAGTAGIGITLTKSGVDLPFKAINVASTKLSVANNATNKTVDLDVVESNLNIANQTGSIGDARITDLAYTKLTSVPSTFAPSAHKSTHVSGGSDAFVKSDVLSTVSRYVEILGSDPASDTGRIWAIGGYIKYYDTSGNPHYIERLENKGIANGYCDLDASTLVPLTRISGLTNTQIAAGASIAYSKLALTNSIVNADIATAAAIAYSKLALTGNIVNADIAAAAAIAYTKLALTGTIVNTDIATGAAIGYSKLNLATSIINSDIATTAAIAHSKIGTNLLLSETGLTAARTITFPDATTTLVGTADSRLSDARTPTAHKATHVSGGTDAFAKTDILTSVSRYIELIGTDPASADTGRVWVNGADLKFWDNTAVTPVKQTAERLANKGVASGYCDLDSSTLVPLTRISGLTNTQIAAGAAIAYTKLALTNSIINADIATAAAIAYSKLALTGTIVNTDIATAAAIAYSKLALAGSIVNADISGTAAIAYSKLALSGSIVNADIATGAVIAYAKLNLATSIVNADISATAAIAYSKLSLATSIVNGDISATAAIAYSKLALGTSIVNGDIATAAAIAYSKLGTNLKFSETGLTAVRTFTFPDLTTTLVGTADSRLSDARTPTAHATTHQSGGTDAIPLDTLAATTDITTLNSSTTAHGLLKKLDNTATHYMDGTGNWSTPAGSGGGTTTFIDSYTYTVYNDAGTIKARNNKTGVIDFSNANLDPVITSIIATADASLEVQSGTYNLSSGFAGWNVASAATIKLQQDTVVKVPNAYTGYVWSYGSTIQYSSIEGGRYDEQGTPASNWTCFKFQPGTPNGAFQNAIKDTSVLHANYAIHLLTNTLSWINSNYFENIFANQCKYLVFFEHTSTFTAQTSGSNGNHFVNCVLQSAASGPQVLGGIVNVNGWWNKFDECLIWDIAASNASAASMTITANANHTIVIGGILTNSNYSNSGADTMVLDAFSKSLPTLYSSNTFTGFNYYNITAAGGFENVAKWSVGSSADYLSITNNVSATGSFASLIQANQSSANADRFTPGLYFQNIAKSATDLADGESNIIFGATITGPSAFVNRPLFSFRNGISTDVLQVFPTYSDFKNNSIKNAGVKANENTLSGVSQDPIVKRTGRAQPISTVASPTAITAVNLVGILSGHTPTGPGTNTNTWDTTEGLLVNWITTTTINQNAGLVSPTAGIGIARRAFATRFRIRSKIDTVAGSVSRFYFGFTSLATLPISDTPLATTDSGVMVGFRSTDTNYTIFTNSGGGAALTATALSTPIAKDTAFHTIEINWTAGGNANIIFDGVTTTVSTALPATTTNLFFNAVAQNATAAIRTHSVKGIWAEIAG